MERRAAAAVSVRAASTLRARAAAGLVEQESGERSAAPGGGGDVSGLVQRLACVTRSGRVSVAGGIRTVDDDVGPGAQVVSKDTDGGATGAAYFTSSSAFSMAAASNRSSLMVEGGDARVRPVPMTDQPRASKAWATWLPRRPVAVKVSVGRRHGVFRDAYRR